MKNKAVLNKAIHNKNWPCLQTFFFLSLPRSTSLSPSLPFSLPLSLSLFGRAKNWAAAVPCVRAISAKRRLESSCPWPLRAVQSHLAMPACPPRLSSSTALVLFPTIAVSSVAGLKNSLGTAHVSVSLPLVLESTNRKRWPLWCWHRSGWGGVGQGNFSGDKCCRWLRVCC